MLFSRRGRFRSICAFALVITLCYCLWRKQGATSYSSVHHSYLDDGQQHWRALPDRFPVAALHSLPHGRPPTIPRIQADAPRWSVSELRERRRRQQVVRESFVHSWSGYKSHAWLRDEVAPVSGEWRDTFGGWAATLVDSLDTLWLLGLKEDFEDAVKASLSIDFTTTQSETINMFETTIRYLGGFLAAYEISEQKYPELLVKAREVGDLLLGAFDTPNRWPITRWHWAR